MGSTGRQKVRLTDVARAAGVSAPTVSRALRDHPDIPPSTRERIREIADRLGYRPSTVARALRTGRHSTISILLPTSTFSWWQPVLEGAIEEAMRQGYRLLVQPLPRSLDHTRNVSDAGLLQALGDAVTMLPVDGAILVLQEALTAEVAGADVGSLPIVAFDDVHEVPYWPSVSADNEDGAYVVTKHLLDSGRRHPVAIAPILDAAYIGQRIAGFQRALREAGIEVDDANVLHTPDAYSPVPPYSPAIEELLGREIEFDSVFAVCDYVAFPAMRSLQRAGLSVPTDVSVVGFDDERGSEISDPTLTSMHQPYTTLGERLVQLLLAQIGGAELAPGRELLAAELVVRDSSRVESRVEELD